MNYIKNAQEALADLSAYVEELEIKIDDLEEENIDLHAQIEELKSK